MTLRPVPPRATLVECSLFYTPPVTREGPGHISKHVTPNPKADVATRSWGGGRFTTSTLGSSLTFGSPVPDPVGFSGVIPTTLVVDLTESESEGAHRSSLLVRPSRPEVPGREGGDRRGASRTV